MTNRFFKPTLKAVELSPFFLFKAFCGISLIYDMSQNTKTEPPNHDVIRFLLVFRFLVPSLGVIKANYDGYRHALSFIDNYGYRKKWASWFIDSTCGRQQLQMACRERHCLEKYQQHIIDAKIKWYHIDQKKSLRFLFPLDFVFTSSATFISRNDIKNQKEERNQNPGRP